VSIDIIEEFERKLNGWKPSGKLEFHDNSSDELAILDQLRAWILRTIPSNSHCGSGSCFNKLMSSLSVPKSSWVFA
jgi:hypothetical protein